MKSLLNNHRSQYREVRYFISNIYIVHDDDKTARGSIKMTLSALLNGLKGGSLVYLLPW